MLEERKRLQRREKEGLQSEKEATPKLQLFIKGHLKTLSVFSAFLLLLSNNTFLVWFSHEVNGQFIKQISFHQNYSTSTSSHELPAVVLVLEVSSASCS